MRLTLLAAVTLALFAADAQADSVKIPSTAQGQGSYREMPRRGMSMDQVELRFGAPVRKLAPVGKPPISRWTYDGYTVYFERNHVIESVLDGAPAARSQRSAPPTAERQLLFTDDPVLESGRSRRR